jgi:putative SOS response-associated peptidase YedK
MCNHFQAESRRQHLEAMGVELSPTWRPPGSTHIHQTDFASFIRRPFDRESGRQLAQGMDLSIGRFGMLPRIATDVIYIKHQRSHIARTDTRMEKPAFKQAWLKPWHCIVPCHAIYAADWRSGEYVPMRFAAADHGTLGVAGLWCPWQDPVTQKRENTFAVLTINADDHPLFRLMQQADEERRMPVILPEATYGAWLDASPEESMAFMRQFPAEALVMTPDPLPPRKPNAKAQRRQLLAGPARSSDHPRR